MTAMILAACLGTFGFALMMKMHIGKALYASLGAGLAWLAYLLCHSLTEGTFLPYLLAAVLVAAFAEWAARWKKAPATVFLTTAALPLIPGRNLYYMMYGIVTEDYSSALENLMAVAICALAITIGFLLVTLSVDMVQKQHKKGEPRHVH